MKNATINREGRDALFRIVFGENKENALALYNAINHSDYDVEKLIFECSFDMEKACEILGVEIADYKSWKAKRSGKPKV